MNNPYVVFIKVFVGAARVRAPIMAREYIWCGSIAENASRGNHGCEYYEKSRCRYGGGLSG